MVRFELQTTVMNRFLLLVCALAWLGISCNKEGIGGKSVITGMVLDNTTTIPNAMVYIKYGASTWPGFDVELYDDQTTSSSSSAAYTFTNLYKGDYYIWATGENTTISESVSGGVAIILKTKKETLEINIPVTK